MLFKQKRNKLNIRIIYIKYYWMTVSNNKKHILFIVTFYNKSSFE